jgi:hypothetical protein
MGVAVFNIAESFGFSNKDISKWWKPHKCPAVRSDFLNTGTYFRDKFEQFIVENWPSQLLTHDGVFGAVWRKSWSWFDIFWLSRHCIFFLFLYNIFASFFRNRTYSILHLRSNLYCEKLYIIFLFSQIYDNTQNLYILNKTFLRFETHLQKNKLFPALRVSLIVAASFWTKDSFPCILDSKPHFILSPLWSSGQISWLQI